jgi:hypothetical protein
MCNIVVVVESPGPNMLPGKHSSVKISSVRIAEMCQTTLTYIKQRRIDKKEKQIKDIRAAIVKGFWHRFWKRPVPTDEEIIAIANDYHNSFSWWYEDPDSLYWETERLCKKLLVACKQAEEINISVADLDQIS